MRLHSRVLQLCADFGDYYHVKVHVIQGERRAIIDTGLVEHPTDDFVPTLRDYGLTLKDINLSLATHGHGDHVDGSAPIREASGAELWLHTADVQMVEQPGWLFDHYKAPPMRLMGKGSQVASTRAGVVERTARLKVDHALSDGEVVDLGSGVKLRVIPMPGHTPGSVGFYWEEEGWLFTGDSLQGQGVSGGELPILYEPLAYGRMLEKVMELPIDRLVLGHYYQALTVSANNVKRQVDGARFLRDCLQVHDLILEATSRAMHRHWGEPFPRVLAATLEDLGSKLYLRLDPNTGVPPPFGAETIAAYYLGLGGEPS